MKNQRCDPWDRKIKRWLDRVEWEVLLFYLFLIFIGFCLGAFFVMIKHQHFVSALLEQTK